MRFGAAYLLSHGLVNVVLVTALLRSKRRASLGLVALTAFDAIVAWLAYREYRMRPRLVRRA